VGEIDVWLTRMSAASDEGVERCRAGLAPDELAICGKFHHDADRRRAVVTRSLVRTTLSRYVPVPAESWRFEHGVHGRPEIAAPAGTGLRFNVSHTREIVVCAVARGSDVGVDVERFDSTRDLRAVASNVCSADELSAMRAMATEAFEKNLLALWTLKEAYLKARGLGFALQPSHLTFDLDAEAGVAASFSPEVSDDPARWWFATLDAGDEHLLSIALGRPGAPSSCALFEAVPCGAGVRGVAPRVLRASSPMLPS
jgi:4'-phosphopantetheinyl transferase